MSVAVCTVEDMKMPIHSDEDCFDCEQVYEDGEDCPYCLAEELTRDCPEDRTTLHDLLDSLVEHHSELTSQFYALRMSLPDNLTEDAENALATLIDCYVAKHCA